MSPKLRYMITSDISLRTIHEARIFVQEVCKLEGEHWCLGLLTNGGGRYRLEEILDSNRIVWTTGMSMQLVEFCSLCDILLPLMKCCKRLITNFPHLTRQIHTLMSIFNSKDLFMDKLVDIINDESQNIIARLSAEDVHAVAFFAVKLLRASPRKETCQKFQQLVHQLEDRASQLSNNSNPHEILLTLNALKTLIERYTPSDANLKRMQRSRTVASSHLLPYFWPGDLNESGARHSNDFVDIAQVRIIPTLDELLSEVPPCLPQNRADAPHHHPPESIQRLVDVHFRLFRHDCIANLAEVVRHIAAHKGAVFDWFHKHMGSDRQKLDAESSSIHSVFVFRNVRFLKTGCDKVFGIVCTYEMDQIVPLRRASQKEMEKKWKEGAIHALQKDDVVLLFHLGKLLAGQLNESIQLATVTSPSPTSIVSQHFNRLQVSLKLQVTDLGSTKLFQNPSEKYGIIDPRQGFYSFQDILKTLQLVEEETISPVLNQLQLSTQPLFPGTPKYLSNTVWNFHCLIEPTRLQEMDAMDLEFLKQVPAVALEDDSSKREVIRRLQQVSYLDSEQADAVISSLHRSLAITQGPPGNLTS